MRKIFRQGWLYFLGFLVFVNLVSAFAYIGDAPLVREAGRLTKITEIEARAEKKARKKACKILPWHCEGFLEVAWDTRWTITTYFSKLTVEGAVYNIGAMPCPKPLIKVYTWDEETGSQAMGDGLARPEGGDPLLPGAGGDFKVQIWPKEGVSGVKYQVVIESQCKYHAALDSLDF